jgi:hypothetical protein
MKREFIAPRWPKGSRAMQEVVVGVVLTALLGGLLIPIVKGIVDRRSERFNASVALVDTLAASLWEYWKLALRVAYYGRQGERGAAELGVALQRWDSDGAWKNGCEIQIQVSRSKRLLPGPAQRTLDKAQGEVVTYLDNKIDDLRKGGTPEAWELFYKSLMVEKRLKIDSLLADVTSQLKIG